VAAIPISALRPLDLAAVLRSLVRTCVLVCQSRIRTCVRTCASRVRLCAAGILRPPPPSAPFGSALSRMGFLGKRNETSWDHLPTVIRSVGQPAPKAFSTQIHLDRFGGTADLLHNIAIAFKGGSHVCLIGHRQLFPGG
jgi:hypothetical protein